MQKAFSKKLGFLIFVSINKGMFFLLHKLIISFIESGDNKKEPNFQKLISLHVENLLG